VRGRSLASYGLLNLVFLQRLYDGRAKNEADEHGGYCGIRRAKRDISEYIEMYRVLTLFYLRY